MTATPDPGDTAGVCPQPRRGTAQDALDALETQYQLTDRWANARNAWVKRILPARKGDIGERMLAALATDARLDVLPRTGKGHDRRVAGLKTEVKLSTSYDAADPQNQVVKWLQLRPSDEYDIVALIAVCPDHTHVWLVDKATALAHATGQHGGKHAEETRQLEVLPDQAPAWLGPDVNAGGKRLRRRIRTLTKARTADA